MASVLVMEPIVRNTAGVVWQLTVRLWPFILMELQS